MPEDAALPSLVDAGWRTLGFGDDDDLVVVNKPVGVAAHPSPGWTGPTVIGGLAAVVFGVFVASMTTSRLAGTRVIDRFGRWPVLMASSSLALIGLVLFGIAPSLPVAVLGVVAWGLGSGLVIPIAMAVVAGDGMGAAAALGRGHVAENLRAGQVRTRTAYPVDRLRAAARNGSRQVSMITSPALFAVPAGPL